MQIGKIVNSTSHIDYTCQIYGLGEHHPLPAPEDYAFGNFVSIQVGGTHTAISHILGIAYNTQLMNPDFGTLGPRLNSSEQTPVFTPDFLLEQATLVGILALGWKDTDGHTYQGVPPITASVNDTVTKLEEEEIEHFHQNQQGGPRLSYMPILLNQNHPLVPQLQTRIVDQLLELFPFHQNQLSLIRNNLAWRSIVQPAS
ncbi:MAG: hypothetical protein AAF702_47055 [Chloroflexota bacterium]